MHSRLITNVQIESNEDLYNQHEDRKYDAASGSPVSVAAPPLSLSYIWWGWNGIDGPVSRPLATPRPSPHYAPRRTKSLVAPRPCHTTSFASSTPAGPPQPQLLICFKITIRIIFKHLLLFLWNTSVPLFLLFAVHVALHCSCRG